MGDELQARRAVDRLMSEGLDRHEAVHALMSVLVMQMNQALKDPSAHAFPTASYNEAVERLTAESWRREFSDESGGEDEDDR